MSPRPFARVLEAAPGPSELADEELVDRVLEALEAELVARLDDVRERLEERAPRRRMPSRPIVVRRVVDRLEAALVRLVQR